MVKNWLTKRPVFYIFNGIKRGITMAKKTTTKAKETKRMRKERISNSNNGATMRTRVVKDKKKYTRKTKHKKYSKEEVDAMFRELDRIAYGR